MKERDNLELKHLKDLNWIFKIDMTILNYAELQNKKIDNFLNASDFSELSNYARNLSINEDITVYHNEIDEKNNIIESH